MALLFAAAACSDELAGAPREASATATLSAPLLASHASSESYVVAVQVSSPKARRLCTGTVLDAWHVLTAAHCFAVEQPGLFPDQCQTPLEFSSDAMGSVIASNDVNTATASQRYGIAGLIFPHQHADPCGEDLVLLELARALPLTVAFIAPAVSRTQPDTLFTAIGHGSNGEQSGHQGRRDDAALLCAGACADARLGQTELLVDSGACPGDSGGPALTASGELFGIAARSAADCSESAYEPLRPQLKFLADELARFAKAHHASAPAWTQHLAPQEAQGGAGGSAGGNGGAAHGLARAAPVPVDIRKPPRRRSSPRAVVAR